MRKFLVLAALALASCGDKAQTNNNAVTDESGAGEVTAVNDTTAIDAATGEAANMAEDVNYMFNEADGNESSNEATPKSSRKAGSAPSPASEPDEPATGNDAG